MDKFDIYVRVIELAESLDDRFLELGAFLKELQSNDKKAFQEALTIPQLGRRKAYYLLSIFKAFEKLEIEKELLIKIGWTRLAYIAPHVEPDNVDLLLWIAHSNTAENVIRIMKGEKPIKNARVIHLYMTGDQYAAYSRALTKYGAVKSGNGLSDQVSALMAMISALP